MITREEYEHAVKIVLNYTKQKEEEYLKVKSMADKIHYFFIDENTRLKDCNLSVRCLNVLHDIKEITIKAFTEQYRPNDVMKIRNMGAKSYKEIKELIYMAGIFDWK